jgi:septum formation protein
VTGQHLPGPNLPGLNLPGPQLPGPRLVLASASPARLATLRAAGIDPIVQPSSVDEEALLEQLGLSDPAKVPQVLAQAKAEDVAAARLTAAAHITDAGRAPEIVVGCDSILDLDGAALGKPASPDDAVRRWRQMRGRTAVLRTGHWLIDTRVTDGPGPFPSAGATSATDVTFAEVSDAEIDAYVATGEPLAVAGAFTIDGLGGAFVTAIRGDHHGVVGISLPLLRELAASLAISWPSLWTRGANP